MINDVPSTVALPRPTPTVPGRPQTSALDVPHSTHFSRRRWRASSTSRNYSHPSPHDRGFNQRGNGSAFSAGGADKPLALATSICHERLSGANKRNSQIPSVFNGQVKSQPSPKSFSYSNLCLTQPFSGTQTYWNTICGANSLPIPPRTADRFGPLMVTVRRMKTQVPFRIRQTSHRY